MKAKKYFNELLKRENSMSREASNYPCDGSLMFEWGKRRQSDLFRSTERKSINEKAL